MKNYDVFLIDADGTLFNFELAEATAFRTVFEACGFKYSEKILTRYSAINDSLWKKFETGDIKVDEIKTHRFIQLFNEIGVEYDANDFNNRYVVELAKGAFLIEGAREICEKITFADKKIYIVTNGLTHVQRTRLSNSPIKEYITECFISELIGYQKPDIRYFEYVLSQIPHISKDKILMIGDSLTADIAGGNNANIDTCWFNEKRIKNQTNIKPTYEITKLNQMQQFVINNVPFPK